MSPQIEVTNTEKALLTYLYLEGAFTTDLAVQDTKMDVTGVPHEARVRHLAYLLARGLLDQENAEFWLTPMGNLYTSLLLGSRPREKWRWI